MTKLSRKARALSHKTPWYLRMLGESQEHRVEVTGVVIYPDNYEPKTRIYFQGNGVWRIEESLYEFVEN